MIPLLLAATPLPVGSAVPFREPVAVSTPLSENFGQQAPVRTFDPVARAVDLASTMPRQWSGTYQSFAGGSPMSVQLDVSAVQAMRAGGRWAREHSAGQAGRASVGGAGRADRESKRRPRG